MRRTLLLVSALSAAASVARAQVTDSSPFRPLPLPDPGLTRAASGAPGPRYWQNRADYTLQARLDTATFEVRGSGQIRYVNRSPDSLGFVWLQLDQNVFAANSINRQVPQPALLFGGTPFSFAATGPAGGYSLDSLTADRGVAGTYLWDTMLRVDLQRPLGPGDTLRLSLGWRFVIPQNGLARMGRDGRLLEIAQWYPRMAVYDDVRGWNTLPYIGSGEFYLEYGDFDVRLTVPASYIVAATGELQNADSVLTATQRQRLARARATSDVVQVITREEAGNPGLTRPSGAGTRTWRFTAQNVRDFAWAAAPNFRWDAARYDAGPQGVKMLHTFYRPEATSWEAAIRMTRHAIQSFSERWAAYPYPQASAVEGPIQGMEYPMIVFVPADTSLHGLSWVLMHELGHEWFPMLVGNDERRHPWMDEGFNSFIDLYTVADWWRGRDDEHADSVLNGPLGAYAGGALPGVEVPMAAPPSESRDVYWTAYQKPALMLRLLREEVLGPEVFDQAFREFIRRWQNRHPQPADFFRTVENVSGRDLAWFWRGWIYTTARLDQAVDSVTVAGDTTRIALSSRREMIMPVELRITFDSGAAEMRRIPVQMWSYGPRHVAKVAAGGRRVTRVEVDPREAYPDVDRANNRWSASTPVATVTPAAAAAPVAPDTTRRAGAPAAAAAGAAAGTAAGAAAAPAAAAPAPAAQAPAPVPAAATPAAAAAAAATPEAAITLMRSDLASLVRAEQQAFARTGRYSTDLAAIGFRASEGVSVTVGYATAEGWRAISRHAATGTRCMVFGGNATPPSDSARPEEPICR
jgi:hypothetical protein